MMFLYGSFMLLTKEIRIMDDRAFGTNTTRTFYEIQILKDVNGVVKPSRCRKNNILACTCWKAWLQSKESFISKYGEPFEEDVQSSYLFRPFSYIVEEMAEDGSKFPEVHAFELAYAGKNKCWTDNIAKTQYDEMLVKIDEYLLQKVKEQQLPEDTPLEEIPVDDPEAGLNIMMSVLGEIPGRQIRGLGNGRLRNIRTTSHVRNLEQELEVERTARKAADTSRVKMEERMQNKLKVVGQKFNSTLQSLHHSMQQICHNIPDFVMPPITPLSIDEAFEEDGYVEGEENNFEEEQNFDEDE